MTTSHEPDVDALAERLWLAWQKGAADVLPWGEVSDVYRKTWRNVAREAVDALREPATGHTRAQFARAVDEAHEHIHTWERQAGPGHPLAASVASAHEALHSVGAGTERTGCATPDPEAQAVVRDLMKAYANPTPCGHTVGDLILWGGQARCASCLADTARGTPKHDALVSAIRGLTARPVPELPQDPMAALRTFAMALDDRLRNLRLAAEAYFGGDFRKP